MGAPSDTWAQYRAEVEARLDLKQIFSDIQNAKPSGNGCMLGLCPFHDDHDPSFGFSTTTGCWQCFAEDIKGGPFDYLMRRSGREFKEVLVEMGDSLGLPRPSANGDGTGQIIYDYRDEAGALLHQVLRGPGKKFFQRRPDGHGGWINDLKGVRRVLYRLPELLARATETVFVCEGEKDCDALRRAGLLATTNSGGAGKWKESYSESLRGRDIVILPDNDAPGRAHALQIAQSVHGLATSVRIVELPDLPPKGDVSDWLDSGHTAADLQDLAERTPLWESLSEEIPGTGRPVIQVTDHQLQDIYDDTWRVLLARNDPPCLFVSAGQLARLVNGEGGPRIQFLDQSSAYGVVVRAADWMQERGGVLRASKAPKEVASDILSNPHPDLPALDAIVGSPVFDAEGHLLLDPGYHASARLWLHYNDEMRVHEVPSQPTEDQVAGAVTLLCEDLLVDFPFAAPSDLAHALAALILPFVRRMIPGPTPIHEIEAPTPGSGKGLIADVISIIALGRSCEVTTITKDEDEARKKLTAILSRGHPVVVFDNIRGALESAQLAAAITAEIWSDRILGKTQMVEFPNRAVWVMTANNPKLSLEIARRCVRIRLEPPEERPWERTKFKHAPLRIWAKEHRQELIEAVLIICQSWIAAGRPPGTRTLGSFEHWAATVGGILQHAGVTDFLQDTNEFYAAADLESGEWRALVQAWWEKYGGQPVGARELIALAEESDLLAFAYAAKSEQTQRARFGRALSDLRGRRFGDLQVTVGENSNRKIHTYRLMPVAERLFGDKEPF
jgi:hypothetical protein